MLVFAAFYGLGNGAFLGTGTNYIYELAPVELRATAHSLFISVAQISGILGNLLGGVLFDTIGGKSVLWRNSLRIPRFRCDLRRKAFLPPQ